MSRQCRLLDNPKLVSQLCSLERRAGRSGKDNIDHPSGSGNHDDLANSAAGAIVLAMQSSGRVLGYIDFLKGIASGKIQDPTIPAAPASFNEPKPINCAHCESNLVNRCGNAWHCVQCGNDTSLGGQPIAPPAASEPCGCGLPLISIPGGMRCNQCGMQFVVGVQSKNGPSRKQYEKRNPRDHKPILSYPGLSRRSYR
jgi:hypothetical protein